MNSILAIGKQELYNTGEYYKFEIKKVKDDEKGFKFAFSIRKKAIDELIRRDKSLEVSFAELPDLKFKYTAQEWKQMGKFKRETHNFKDTPLELYYFYVNFAGEISRLKQAQGQLTLPEYEN